MYLENTPWAGAKCNRLEVRAGSWFWAMRPSASAAGHVNACFFRGANAKRAVSACRR